MGCKGKSGIDYGITYIFINEIVTYLINWCLIIEKKEI